MILKNKKLANYILCSVIVSLVVSIFTWFLTCIIISFLIYVENVQKIINSEKAIIFVAFSYGIGLIVVLATFLITFFKLVNPKITYIKYISEQIQKIEQEGMDVTVKEVGNDELTQLSRSINSMSSQLKARIEKEKESDRASRELITNVSHDLRTPLTSIIGYVDLLKNNGFKDEEKFNEYIEVVERRIGGLNVMINELFEYTKLEFNDKQLDLKNVDIIPPINHLINEYKIIYKKYNLNLNVNSNMESCIVNIDYNKMIRVFENLLDNAKKYAKNNSTIFINIYKKGDLFCFNIDNEIEKGISIDVEKICERFYKSDISRTCPESSGLGLAIVKRIIELHGGDLKITYNNERINFLMLLKSK